MSDTERAMVETEAASLLGLSVKTLRAWRCHGRGPRFVKLGRAVRYLRSDVDEFIRKNTVSTSMSDVFCGTL
jgi:excisionase family DNA binding protein